MRRGPVFTSKEHILLKKTIQKSLRHDTGSYLIMVSDAVRYTKVLKGGGGRTSISQSFADPAPDPAPDPAIFVSDLQDGNFFAYYFLKVHLHHFSKIKRHKKSHKTVGIKVFLTISA